MNMLSLMYVAVGGAVGAMSRYLLVTLITRLAVASDFPYGTLAVNILGSLLMGIWIGCMATMMPSRAKDLHLLFAVGALGGFTTFSAFSVDVFLLLERGMQTQAVVYVVSSVIVSVLALIAGMWVTRLVA